MEIAIPFGGGIDNTLCHGVKRNKVENQCREKKPSYVHRYNVQDMSFAHAVCSELAMNVYKHVFGVVEAEAPHHSERGQGPNCQETGAPARVIFDVETPLCGLVRGWPLSRGEIGNARHQTK